jgi:hypothetical protein
MLIPIIASRFIGGWAWSFSDYVFAAVMIFAAGSLFELGRGLNKNLMYRAGSAIAVATGFMIIWGNGAVGFIGSEDNPANLMYGAALAIAFLGAIIARFKPQGMAKTMYSTAAAMALVPVIALILNSNFQEIPEAVGKVGVFALNTVFVILFIGSGLLFRNASAERPVPKEL